MLLIRKIWLDMKEILRLARQIIDTELEPLNLSGAEGDLLFLLLTGSNNLQQEQLAEQLDKGKAAVSRTVASLESKGYVIRVRNNSDKRAFNVTLTEKAFSVGEEIKEIYDELYVQVREGIADEEFIQVESLLKRVAENLKSQGER